MKVTLCEFWNPQALRHLAVTVLPSWNLQTEKAQASLLRDERVHGGEQSKQTTRSVSEAILSYPALVKTSQTASKAERRRQRNTVVSLILYPLLPQGLSSSPAPSSAPFWLTKWSQLTATSWKDRKTVCTGSRTGETSPGSAQQINKGQQVWSGEESRGFSPAVAMETEEELIKKQKWSSQVSWRNNNAGLKKWDDYKEEREVWIK